MEKESKKISLRKQIEAEVKRLSTYSNKETIAKKYLDEFRPFSESLYVDEDKDHQIIGFQTFNSEYLFSISFQFGQNYLQCETFNYSKHAEHIVEKSWFKFPLHDLYDIATKIVFDQKFQQKGLELIQVESHGSIYHRHMIVYTFDEGFLVLSFNDHSILN